MRTLFALSLLVPTLAHASPNVSPEDPRYDELATKRALGELPLYLGGYAPLTEARVRSLLAQPALPDGFWLRADRGLLRLAYDIDRTRRYSTGIRPRDIEGSVAVTCEHAQGRPCGTKHVLGEADVSAGYGDWVSGTLRLRGDIDTTGTGVIPIVDRAYVIGELGYVNVEVGRDILVIGPRSRTQLAWGDHAPALDQIRVSTAEPIALGESLRGSAFWSVGRLRDPQRFPGNLLSIPRVQLDIVDRIELGAMQLLQTGGEGAAEIGPVDFVLEHLRRRDLTASATDSSNRRFGGDVTFTVPDLRGARFYYAVMFEDVRKKYWHHAVREDADHLWGMELAAVPYGGRMHGVVVEYHQTGFRSQEHSPRTTGLTNAGRVGGSPLGPDAVSAYLGARIELPHATLYPWLEHARIEGDIYGAEEDGPIVRVTDGPTETRNRFGLRGRLRLPHGLSFEAETIVEHVSQFAFDPDTSRTNWRLAGSLVYRALDAHVLAR